MGFLCFSENSFLHRGERFMTTGEMSKMDQDGRTYYPLYIAIEDIKCNVDEHKDLKIIAVILLVCVFCFTLQYLLYFTINS